MVARGSTAGFIFGVVGPSGGGKSAVIEEMLRRFPDDLVLMRSLTTRARRSSDEDRTTRFVSRSEFLELAASNALVQWVEYDNNLYGDALADVDEIVMAGKHAIRPLIEDSIRSFRSKGYKTLLIRIAPAGDAYRNRSAERAVVDIARANANTLLVPDLDVTNRFEPGGLQATCDIVAEFIARHVAR